MNMKKVEKDFVKGGFHHKQLRRVGNVAIFRRQGLTCPNPHYEVVKISKHNGYKIGGARVEAAETYPGASLWGLQGWTCQTLEAAQVQFKIACKRFNKKTAVA
jgi:hypothetical protein